MDKPQCCTKVGLKKGPWSPEEDQKLLAYIENHGLGSWRALPAKAGLQRCGKSCRLRWRNYLRPDIKRGKFSLQEEQTIIQLHALLGNRWSLIANQLPKRTDNEIKNYWNTHLKKRLNKMGIDPATHKPKTNALGSVQAKDAANISHLAQWETARLEAELRLAPKSSNKPVVNQFASVQRPPTTKATAHQRPAPPSLLVVPQFLDVLRASQGAWTNPNGFFSPKGTLTSPTSTLHFPGDHIVSFTSPGSGAGAVGANLAQIGCFANSNAYEVGITEENIKKNEEFPSQLPNDVGDENIADSLGLPSFMEGFVGSSWSDNGCINRAETFDGRSPCGNDLEDNIDKYYWNHLLDSVTFTSGSPVF